MISRIRGQRKTPPLTHVRWCLKIKRVIFFLNHPNVLFRAISSLIIGLLILFAVWTISYLWFPEGVFKFYGSLIPESIGTGDRVLILTLEIFLWNFFCVGGLVALASMFVIGKLPASYLVPWFVCAAYGALLGTNSFTFPDPAEPLAPNIAIFWQRAGIWEITAYFLIASALASVYLWRQRSWWGLGVKKIRSWRQIRLSRQELLFIAMAVVLLLFAAFREAGHIVHY